MTNRIHPREVEGLDTPGSGAVVAGAVSVTPVGSLTSTDVQAALAELDTAIAGGGGGGGATALVPLTTVVAGVPELVWDDDNNLVMTEVPR